MSERNIVGIVVLVTCDRCNGSGRDPHIGPPPNREVFRCYVCRGRRTVNAHVTLDELRALMGVPEERSG